MYSSHQWCGNVEEYFSKNSEKVVVFLMMQRIKNKDNLLRIYEKGELVKEENIALSENIFLYYLFYYLQYIRALVKYFSRNDKVIVISFHPYPFFFMTIQKILFNVRFVFWVGDYFPPINTALILFERLKKFYHDGIPYTRYLGDGVNKVMNGKVLATENRKTIMWGVKSKNIIRNLSKIKYTLLYVGVVRNSVGLDIAYDFLRTHKKYRLKMIGICDATLYKKQKEMIKNYNIEGQVYFPNRFFYDDELNKVSKDCLVGLALYTTDNTNVIYYSDPGKVKAYAEMGLPIIMSKTSSVEEFVKKFKAGEVIDRDVTSLERAVKNIQGNYKLYTDGVAKFNRYFYFEDYYRKGFKFLEEANN